MAGRIFTIGDTHFGHHQIFTFAPTRCILAPTLMKYINDAWDGEIPVDKLRDYIHENAARREVFMLEHNEELIKRWNEVVDNKDVVYHMGDVATNKGFYYAVVPRLNGIKKLIRGNHDDLADEVYHADFNKILGPIGLKVNDVKVWLTHIPIHPQEFYNYALNIHGHIHENNIMLPFNPVTDVKQEKDLRYVNVCCEHTNFAPILLKDLVEERLKLL